MSQIIRNPDLNTDEILPSGWQELAEQASIREEEVWQHWRRFKTITRWPFELRRWSAYVAKIAENRKAGQREKGIVT